MPFFIAEFRAANYSSLFLFRLLVRIVDGPFCDLLAIFLVLSLEMVRGQQESI